MFVGSESRLVDEWVMLRRLSIRGVCGLVGRMGEGRGKRLREGREGE